MSITLAIIIVTVIGLIGAAILVVAAKFMTVEEDERIGIVAAALPAANCGACGYAGCSDYAKAIVEDGAPVNRCVPGGQKAADAVAAVMGVEAASSTPMRATVMCQGSQENCKTKFEYHGIQSCAAAAGFYGGPSACQYGCLGYGDCVAVCKFDAIKIVDGLSVVDPDKCTGCGACAEVCPKHVISVLPVGKKAEVLCQNKDKGVLTRKACVTGCIGCMKCVKACEQGAIKVENNLSMIDYEKCIGCGACVASCPVHAIVMTD